MIFDIIGPIIENENLKKEVADKIDECLAKLEKKFGKQQSTRGDCICIHCEETL